MSEPTNWAAALHIIHTMEVALEQEYSASMKILEGARRSILQEWGDWRERWEAAQQPTSPATTARMVRSLRKKRMSEIETFKKDVELMKRKKRNRSR